MNSSKSSTDEMQLPWFSIPVAITSSVYPAVSMAITTYGFVINISLEHSDKKTDLMG